MKRETTRYQIPASGIGCQTSVLFHDYYPSPEFKELASTALSSLEWFQQEHVYIQASLHADELPGLLVSHHLIHLLDTAALENRIRKHITIVPYANPIGLNQILQGKHLGRFSMMTGINFNRNWMDTTEKVLSKLKAAEEDGGALNKLSTTDKNHNTALIRKLLYEEACQFQSNKSELLWKRELYKKACIANIVLDLHCDGEAVMHTYTHDRLWPALADLSAAIGSKCNLLAPESGGNPFDEAFSCPWAALQDKLPTYPIEMGCQSATIELRGEYDVYDDLASNDAKNLYAFLVRRGFIEDGSISPLINLNEQVATPLTGVDTVQATAAGVLAWKVHAGDEVEQGQLLGEIVNIDDIDAPRVPLIAQTSGLVYGMHAYKLAIPGDIVIKIAGKNSLAYRTGDLLTAK